MALTLFWLKTGIKRTISLIKSSPLTIIWIMIITGSFIYSITNNYIKIVLDSQIKITIAFLLALFSLLKSLKNYDIMPVLLKHSKSKLQNRHILRKFFIKQAFTNNILLIIFYIITFNSTEDNFSSIIMLTAIIASTLISYLIMRQKNHQKTWNKNEIKFKLKINPTIKSLIYDYLTPDFIATAVTCLVLFIIVAVEFTKNIENFFESENKNIFFIISAIIISIGFIGIVDSIKNINWKFHAIISQNTFLYHIKRTVFFLTGAFGLPILTFIIIGAKANLFLMFKYLFCLIVLYWTSVFIAFTFNNTLTKAFILMLIAAFTLWISTLPAGFLPVLIIPLLAVLLKSKNEYKEWYLFPDNL